MGIPLYFKTIYNNYPEIVISNIDLDKNSYLFLDLNCAIHPCCRKIVAEKYEAKYKDKYEKRMINEVLNYIKKLIGIVDPVLLYIAIDGVAPKAKMNQQRLRRFKTVLDRNNTNDIKKALNIDTSNDFWDTNAISPGTPFMEKLNKAIIDNKELFKIGNLSKIIFSNSNLA